MTLAVVPDVLGKPVIVFGHSAEREEGIHKNIGNPHIVYVTIQTIIKNCL